MHKSHLGHLIVAGPVPTGCTVLLMGLLVDAGVSCHHALTWHRHHSAHGSRLRLLAHIGTLCLPLIRKLLLVGPGHVQLCVLLLLVSTVLLIHY